MKRTVLLTGANGFVGKQIMKTLLSSGSEILVVLREGTELDAEFRSEVVTIVYSEDIFIESLAWWKEHLHAVDIFIHSAWIAKPEEYLDSSLNEICYEGSIVMAQAAIESQVKKFVGIGSYYEYDLDFECLTVETPLNPKSNYAAAKVSTFLKFSEMFAKTSVEFAWCRLFNLYGEGEHEKRLAPYIRQRIQENQIVELTRGEDVRDFLDVSLAGFRIVRVAFSEISGPVNICSGVGIKIKDFATQVASSMGKIGDIQLESISDANMKPNRIVGVMNWNFDE